MCFSNTFFEAFICHLPSYCTVFLASDHISTVESLKEDIQRYLIEHFLHLSTNKTRLLSCVYHNMHNVFKSLPRKCCTFRAKQIFLVDLNFKVLLNEAFRFVQRVEI